MMLTTMSAPTIGSSAFVFLPAFMLSDALGQFYSSRFLRFEPPPNKPGEEAKEKHGKNARDSHPELRRFLERGIFDSPRIFVLFADKPETTLIPYRAGGIESWRLEESSSPVERFELFIAEMVVRNATTDTERTIAGPADSVVAVANRFPAFPSIRVDAKCGVKAKTDGEHHQKCDASKAAEQTECFAQKRFRRGHFMFKSEAGRGIPFLYASTTYLIPEDFLMAVVDDNIQHGIDDDPTGDAEKGAKLGGIGGAVTGAVAGAAAGPVGMVAGAVIGGVAGALGSGAAVAAVDRVDNDNTVSGVGHGATRDAGDVVAAPGNGVPGIQTGGHHVDGTADTRGIAEKTADAVTGDVTDDKTGKRIA